ncbi:MAG: family 78 glycoside hydrolase catalytic domain [Spirochaetes bacterium]|nr:family 78 glycoside hydrolase catalytic domain [Spirochaetota bacterium]
MPHPRKLRTENLVSPLDIDIPHPRFSWQLADSGEPGCRQSAWQIELADAAGSPVWDSGRRSGAEVCTEYNGDPLRSFSRYLWRLRCWDGDGACGGYSRWEAFETAALHPGDMKGKWISHPSPSRYFEGSWESGVPHEQSAREQSAHYMGIYCAKLFSLNGQKIKRARALVSGVGLYCLYLDGARVNDDLLSPAQTDYAKRALYSVYDIAPFLDPERNEHCLAVALGNGRHIALYGFGKPRAYAQILLESEDGDVRWICSDESWKASEGPLRENSLFNGERYDARIAVPSCAGGLQGAANAEVVEGFPLHAAMVPPIRIEKRIDPIRVGRAGEGFVYDFGQNFSGAVELHISVPRGTEMRLSFAELIHEDGTLNTASNRAARSCDRYIASGADWETWYPRMTYHGFRYVLMEGYPGVPPSDAVTGLFFHTEAEREGDFACSHLLFNEIHGNILWGQLSNLMGVPTDSPQRDERHGWLGDALLSSEECLLNFGPVGFYEKFIQDIVDTQSDDGSITDVAPKFWMDKPADPAWGSALISIAWSLYRYKGDLAVLRKHYPAFRAYIGFLERSAKGFLIEELGTFGDWCAPGMVAPKKTGLIFTSSWYFQHDAGTLADIAEVLEDADGAARYRALQSRIVDAMNARFRKEKQYETTPLSRWDFPDQTAQALALCSPLVTGEDRAPIAATLDRLVTADSGDHVGTGIHGTRYLLQALTDSGYAEKAFTLAAQETFPGWGYMVREGATTLWERWEKIESMGMNSHNHIMLGSIDLWFYSAVAGISLAESGFSEIVFSPGMLRKISYAYARIETPAGTAMTAWERRGAGIALDIRIPPGCGGRLRLPKGFVVGSLVSAPASGTRKPLGGFMPEKDRLDSGWYRADLVRAV